jgi:WD40 repeat protein
MMRTALVLLAVVGVWLGAGAACLGQRPEAVLKTEGSVDGLAFSPDGRMLALASGMFGENRLELWETLSRGKRATLRGHRHSIKAVAFSPDGKLLASGSWDNTAKLWDLPAGKATATLRGHTGFVHATAFSPDGRLLASGGPDFTARLWDVPSGKARATLRGHSYAIASLAFSPDGGTLATAGSFEGTVRFWDVGSGRQRGTLRLAREHTYPVSAVAFSPDGKLLAVGTGDGAVSLWDATTWGRRARFAWRLGHETDDRSLSSSFGNLAFSPDGWLPASCGSFSYGPGGPSYRETWLWDLAAGKQVAGLSGESAGGNGVAFSPDGKTLAAAGTAGVYLWPVPALLKSKK